MGIRNPLQRVRGLGSAKSGTEHWWHQRLTSVALVPLSVFLVILMVSLIGADHATVVARVGHPLVAVGLILTLVAIAWHVQLGMQVIIEDYVNSPGWKVSALLANTFFAVVIAVLGVFAVLKISFGA
jgi:succinate dehydrogenase / fumarate reductase, membrane anchor subunit